MDGATVNPSTNAQVSTVLSRAPAGLSAPEVRVEVHVGTGLPAFFMVGLPEAVVRESRERVRAALLTAGFEFPPGRITVNLAPADLPKEGGRFDLPIAVGILAASGQVKRASLAGREFYGELALGGELRETPKLLPALLAGSRSGAEVIVPAANALEARLVGSPNIKLAHCLADVCAALRGLTPLAAAIGAQRLPDTSVVPDLADVCGQEGAKRALEIAAAGGHGMLMIGPPGAGKTLLAQRLVGLMPPLGPSEALEVASLQSAAGRRPSPDSRRPFRNPQHTASVAALIGGGGFRPGELSLAHLGVLFLDELPEFARNVLEALREPLESGVVVLSRAKVSHEFPARFQLIAAMNPCPCGYAGDRHRECRCTADQVHRYRNRLSGPLIDRIDMHVNLRVPSAEELLDGKASGESSAVVARRVGDAQGIQIRRQAKLNARLTAREISRYCPLTLAARDVLCKAMTTLGFSGRALHGAIKLSRTIADLGKTTHITPEHIGEALQLRSLDRPTC